MFDWLKTRDPRRRQGAEMYKRMVELARAPRFYAELGVPDTVEGRFEMISLHVALLLRRLHGVDGALAEAVIKTMWADLDVAIRELGIGDLSVGKKMKLLAQNFYGRAAAYDQALKSEDSAELQAALLRNVYDGEPPAPGAVAALAEYVRDAAVGPELDLDRRAA
ncbi:MAG: ubiquinol-cytochrome c chaperone [Rhodospirillales bacterium]|nr:ubiquinol-cytochrome c chaperone [Rhodospirillales bacterium]